MQEKKSNYSRMSLFSEVDSSIGQVVYMIEGNSNNENLWGAILKCITMVF